MSILSIALQRLSQKLHRMREEDKVHLRIWQKKIAQAIAIDNGYLNSQAGFFASLTKSIVLDRGTGSPTFTRATTGGVLDHEGIIRTAIAGEARFTGARRVRNLINSSDSSEDMTQNDNTSYAVTITPNDITPPSGYSRADKQTSVGALSRTGSMTTYSPVIPAGNTLRLQVVAKAGSGRYLCFGDQADANWHVMTLDTQTGATTIGGTGSDATSEDLGDGWWKMTFKFTKDIPGGLNMLVCHADAASNGAYPFIGAGEYWWATGFQIEDVTGQSVQTAGEYVSVGVPGDWLGDELVTNGDFSDGTTGWSAAELLGGAVGVLSVDSGRLKITNAGASFGAAYQAMPTVVGTKYVMQLNAYLGTASLWAMRIGSSGFASSEYGTDNSGADKTVKIEFVATTTEATVSIYNLNELDAYSFFDNISVKPAVYHGAGVDGIAFFNTDRSGALLSPQPAYLAEGARTNLCLQSNAFTTAPWIQVGTPVPTQNAVGLDGAVSAWTLTDNAPAATELILQTITLTAATYTASVYVDKTTGAQASYPVVSVQTGSTTTGMAQVTVDTSNGVATPWTAYTGWTGVACTAVCESASATKWRISVTFTGTAAAWYFVLIPAGTANATQSIGVYDATAQGSAVFYGAQVELGSFASSYIPTTTVAVTRNADDDQYQTSGNIAAAAGAVYVEFEPTHTPSGTIALWGTYVDASNYTAILHDATNMIMRKRIGGVNYDATFANAFVAGTTYKVLGSWGTGGVTITVDGTEGTPDADTTAAQIGAVMEVGGDGNSAQQPFAGIGNVRVWQRQPSSSERGAITS